jgi:D-arginine dehydrogenase
LAIPREVCKYTGRFGRDESVAPTQEFDFLVIGAGIAGSSAAYELAAEARVCVLEREDMPGYHSTGRSAAVFSETYGNRTIRGLTVASRALYDAPPDGFTQTPLLTPHGMFLIGREDQVAKVNEAGHAFRELVDSVRVVDGDEVRRQIPILKPGYIALAVHEPDAARIDVNALHQGYLRGLTARGGRIATNAEVRSLEHKDGRWQIGTTLENYAAPVVIDAAGAWAGEIGRMASARAIEFTPRRRTAVIVDPPAGTEVDGMPGAADIDENFYFLTDAGRLLVSPADETPVPPSDVQPEEIDVAEAVYRFERVATFAVKNVVRKWAGLRTFAPDRSPVVGFDTEAEGFFWLAGQGGYGIQTAPAMGRTAAALALGREIPRDVAARGVTADALSPARGFSSSLPGNRNLA